MDEHSKLSEKPVDFCVKVLEDNNIEDGFYIFGNSQLEENVLADNLHEFMLNAHAKFNWSANEEIKFMYKFEFEGKRYGSIVSLRNRRIIHLRPDAVNIVIAVTKKFMKLKHGVQETVKSDSRKN